MTDPFEIRPDRLHRYVYLVFAALLVLAGLVGFVTRQDAKVALICLGGGALFGWVGWWRLHDRLVVSSQGLRLGNGPEIAWSDVASYCYRDVSRPWTPSDLGDLLAWPFVLAFRWLIYRPSRAMIRWLLFSANDRRFLDAELVLYDGAGKALAKIKGEDRYVNVAEALDRIVVALHARPLPFTIEGVELDAVATIEVGSTTTIVQTPHGEVEHPTSEIPNLFLLLEAVATRGGRVHVHDDVFVPRTLQHKLAA